MSADMVMGSLSRTRCPMAAESLGPGLRRVGES